MIQYIKDNFKYEYSWNLTVSVVFGHIEQPLNIRVDGEANMDDFENEQMKVLDYLQKNLSGVLLEVESQIFNYYKSNYDEIKLSVNESKRSSLAPVLRLQQDIYNLVTLKDIIVPYCFDPEEIEFGVALDCSWDPSHGLGVLFKNFNYSETGSFDLISG